MNDITPEQAETIINVLTKVIEANAKTIGELEHKLERKVFADEQKRIHQLRSRNTTGQFVRSVK